MTALGELLPRVLAELDGDGNGWTATLVNRYSDSDPRELSGPDGEALLVRLAGRRLTVLGRRPAGVTVCAPGLGGRITVDAGKPPARIAREIERRLLGSYREALPEVRARQAVADAAAAEHDRIVAWLVEVLAPLGGVSRSVLAGRPEYSGPAVRAGEPYGAPYVSVDRFYVDQSYPVKVSVDVMVDQLVPVVAAIARELVPVAELGSPCFGR